MVAESAVSGTTRVTTPRNWRAENTGLNSDRMSSGASGVVSRDAARASLRSRIIYQSYVRLRHSSSPKAYDRRRRNYLPATTYRNWLMNASPTGQPRSPRLRPSVAGPAARGQRHAPADDAGHRRGHHRRRAAARAGLRPADRGPLRPGAAARAWPRHWTASCSCRGPGCRRCRRRAGSSWPGWAAANSGRAGAWMRC